MLLNTLTSLLPSLFPSRPPLWRHRVPMHVHNMILDVVEEAPVKSPLKMWCQRLLSLDYRHEILRQRYKDLSSCYVEEVLHYRQEGLIAHELVVVAIRSGDDRRVIRLERFKQDRADDSSSRIRHKSVLSDFETENSAHIWIADTVENVFAGSTSYRLVQSLPIPASAELTILHVAALATVISEAAKDYSAFHHMCMWWAAMFLKAIASHLKAEPAPGPSYRHAGTIANIPVVTLDGMLVFAIQQLENLGGLLDDAGADEALRLALRNDVERMGLRGDLTSAESITVRFLALARQTVLAFETRLELDVESEKKLEESEKKLEKREREREERERELEKREREREERERELEKRERE
ncbi:hypothetical protein B0H13DRAFT_1710283, partial [Mycena leptocephala]